MVSAFRSAKRCTSSSKRTTSSTRPLPLSHASASSTSPTTPTIAGHASCKRGSETQRRNTPAFLPPSSKEFPWVSSATCNRHVISSLEIGDRRQTVAAAVLLIPCIHRHLLLRHHPSACNLCSHKLSSVTRSEERR